MALFHEGVFLKKSMAEAYMSVFAPTIDSGDSLRPPASRSQTTGNHYESVFNNLSLSDGEYIKF